MKKFKIRNLLAVLMTLVLGIMSVPDIATASPLTEPVIAKYPGTVNGVKRILQVTLNDTGGISMYYKAGDADFISVGKRPSTTTVVVDQYGAIWNLDPDNYGTIMWCSPDLTPDFNSFLGYTDGVESFVMNGPIAVGYKINGKVYSLPTFEEMKDMLGADATIPEPKYIPDPISISPKPTPKPVAQKVSIKKSKSKAFVYEGNKLVSKYTLKSGVLTWYKGKKKHSYKNVKSFTVIEKSKNFFYITKKGAVEFVSFKTEKKKHFIKKNAKKFKESKGFGKGIQMKSKIIDIENK